MARAQPLQSSFAFGEMSPRLLGRSDTDRYRQSLRVCENVITTSHGNAIKRPGSVYLETSPTEGEIRLIDLQADPLNPLVVELGWRTASGGYLRVLDRNGYVSGSPNFTKNPQFLDQLEDWVDGSTGLAEVVWVAPEYAALIPSGGPVTYTFNYNYDTGNGDPVSGEIQHQNAGGGTEIRVHFIDADGVDRTTELALMTAGDTIAMQGSGVTWTIATVNTPGAAWASFDITPTTQAAEAQYAVDFSTTLANETARLQQQVTVDTPANQHRLVTYMYATGSDPVATMNIGTTQGGTEIGSFAVNAGLNTILFTPGTATFWISLEVDATRVGETTICDGIAIVDDAAGIYEAATPWSESDLDKLTTALSTQQVALYFASESQPPQRLVVAGAGVYVFEAVPFTTAPAAWSAGNYPHAVTFYQQRLWFAATPNEPDTIWGSATGNFLSFDLGTGQPADAIEFEMSDRGFIEWIQGARDMLVGCDVAEYVLTSEGGVIIPGDIQIQQQSAYGSAHTQPVEVGNGVLYLGSDLRRIRFMNYQFLEEGWVSLDLTWPSEHLTAPLVKELLFKYAPDPLIWCVLEDGTCLSAVYEREQNNLVGWHRHPFPEGTVESAALTKLGASTELWAAVKRTITGSDVVYIEKTVSLTTITDPVLQEALANYMDGTLFGNVSGTTEEPILDGLGKLEGKQVDLLIAGAVHPPRTVSGGQVSLQPFFAKPGDIALAGLGFTGRMLTLPLEGLNQAGTSQAMRMRRNRIFVRLLSSAIPEINGQVSPSRQPLTPMDTVEPQFTGDIQVANLGWDRFAEVDILMPLPKPYNVLAIFGDAEGNKL